MPHLAPLSWLIAPSMFFLLLMVLMTLMWWQITPSFSPSPSNFLTAGVSEWPWYWSGWDQAVTCKVTNECYLLQ